MSSILFHKPTPPNSGISITLSQTPFAPAERTPLIPKTGNAPPKAAIKAPFPAFKPRKNKSACRRARLKADAAPRKNASPPPPARIEPPRVAICK